MKCCKNWGKSRPRRELNRCACCFFRGAATQRVSIVVIARQWFSCYSWHLHLCMSLLYTGKSPAWLSSLLLASIRGPWKYRKEDHLSPKACLHLTYIQNIGLLYWESPSHLQLLQKLALMDKTSLHASCYFQYSMHKNKALVRIGPKINKHIPTIQNDLSKLFGFM